MKALSIRQPWAFAILHLGKGIENRTRPLRHIGPLAIHAGKQDDPAGYDAIARIVRAVGGDPDDVPERGDPMLRHGGFVGVVDMDGCIESASGDPWFVGPYGLLLSRPRTIQFVPWPGQLGLFDIDETRLGLTSRAKGQGRLL